MSGRRNKTGIRRDRPVRDSTVLLPGRKALMELLKARPSVIKRVYILRTLHGTDEFFDIVKRLQSRDVPVETRTREELDDLLPETHHQGVLTEIVPLTASSIEELLTRSQQRNKIVLALDEIQDPQNLGSFLRLADASGVDGIIMSQNRSASVTPQVRKISAGASEFVPVAVVANLATALRRFKDAGYWILGATLSAQARDLYESEAERPLVVVIGSEGRGLRPLIESLCDFKVSIPMKGHIQSLNAAHAAAVILYELLRKEGC